MGDDHYGVPQAGAANAEDILGTGEDPVDMAARVGRLILLTGLLVGLLGLAVGMSLTSSF